MRTKCYSLTINWNDPESEEAIHVSDTTFEASDDATVLQAVALFLNHVTQREEERETRERAFASDPTLQRDLYRAQLQLSPYRGPDPDGSEPTPNPTGVDDGRADDGPVGPDE